MGTCDLAWNLWVICCLCSFWLCWGPTLLRGKFYWKMLHFDYGYVTCLYVPFYLVGDACTKYVTILLLYVSFLACCSVLCLFEKHMLAFVDMIHALPTRGRKVPNSFIQREFLIKGEKIWKKYICLGGACIHALGALCRLICFVLFCRWCRALLPHLQESSILEHFISVVLSCCPCLGGPRLSLSSDLVLAFGWLLITCLSF
jgi:hypothetical protein